ncbi:DNA primase [Vibrio phage vB_VhaP_VH-5]|uniref:DNA primase n=1 Tax=Vibrio phage vB_VhaP_VH-5 TaxID=2660694 RepID=A0A5Q2W932_9CAUD|nr:DNA primase [Vibrio phage vB_VhaP_VH-5]
MILSGLDLAKRVPVGQHRRHYHGAEKRPNLVVWNNQDSWSCWCHACNEGGKVTKEVLQPVTEAAPVFQKYLSLSDTCTLQELAQEHPQSFKRLVLLLHRKGVSTTLLAPYNPLYSLVDDRLVLAFNGRYVGRDVTERHHAKWLVYHNNQHVPMDFVYFPTENKGQNSEPIVLTEDVLSAIKVHAYTGLSTLWCMGTHVSDAIVTFLITPSTPPKHPVLAFDGDDAGRKATRTAQKRLGLRGKEFSTVTIPEGLDPKDLDYLQLHNLFKDVL